MLHTFKKGYVDEYEKRKTSVLLSDHIRRETARLTDKVSESADRLQRRKDNLQKQHDEAMAASQQQILEASRAYKEAIDKHVEALQIQHCSRSQQRNLTVDWRLFKFQYKALTF
jgi:Skp family chaperone for outer membrane proteins